MLSANFQAAYVSGTADQDWLGTWWTVARGAKNNEEFIEELSRAIRFGDTGTTGGPTI